MLEGYRILDADCHVLEPWSMWQERLPEDLRHRAPRCAPAPPPLDPVTRVDQYGWRGLEPVPVKWEIDGQDVHHRLNGILKAEAGRLSQENFGCEMPEGHSTPQSQLLALDRMGVDVAFLYPTNGLHLLAIDALDPRLTAALAHAYNGWMHDFCAAEPGRFQGVGVVPRHDPQAMVEEVQRIDGWGWRAVHLRPNRVAGRRLADPDYEPFWSECAARGIAVGIHEASHARVPTAGADRFTTRFGMHTCSHPLEQMMALVDLVEGGVLERHPDLQVAFLEAGAGWLPYWLWRLDEEYEALGWEVRRTVRRKPSEYFLRQCFIAVEPGEPGLPLVVETVGADRLLFGSDYPHMDHDTEIVAEAVALEAELGAETVAKILWDNPCRFYRWTPSR